MKTNNQIENRKAIWQALSILYLDTELQNAAYIFMARSFVDSKKSIKELNLLYALEGRYEALKYNKY